MRCGFDEDADDTRICLRDCSTFIVRVSLWTPCLRSASWEIERGERFFFIFPRNFSIVRYFNGDHLFFSTKTVWFKLLIATFNWKNEDIWATTILLCEYCKFIRSGDILHQHVHGKFGRFSVGFTRNSTMHSCSRLTFIASHGFWPLFCVNDDIQMNCKIHIKPSLRIKAKMEKKKNNQVQTAAERHSCEQAATIKATLSLRCFTSKIDFSLLCCCHFDLFWMSSIIIVAKS